MVLSKINDKISYPETKKVNPEDLDRESDLYQITVEDVDIIIAVGGPKNAFNNFNVTYFPVYLVKKNDKVLQIGVYEIKASNILELLDENSALDLEKIDDPLIYTFVSKDMLQKLRMVPSSEVDALQAKANADKEKEKAKTKVDSEKGTKKKEDKSKGKDESNGKVASKGQEVVRVFKADDLTIPETRAKLFHIKNGLPILPPLKEETETVAVKIRKAHKESSADNWVVRFMNNPNYSILDNEGGGDCFFCTVRDAFMSIGQETSVHLLRKQLAAEATEQQFRYYKDRYDEYNDSIRNDSNQIERLTEQYNNQKKIYDSTLDRETKLKITVTTKAINEQIMKLKQETKITKENIRDYNFIKDIKTLTDFRKHVLKSSFWADAWALNAIERLLNIKFIILSFEMYKNGDMENVLNCGAVAEPSRVAFSPEFYIIVEYSGNHYKTIGYKEHMIFSFNEIPYDIKTMIVNKCMERNSGTFTLIPEFNRFKSNLTLPEIDESARFEELSQTKVLNLYDDDVVLQFYELSNKSSMPGKGAGEKYPERMNPVQEFSDLRAFEDWRKKLNVNWLQPFTLDNHRWNSVEHYYQASKFKKGSPDFYLSFSLDSGTELSKNPEMAKAAGEKKGRYEGVLIRPSEAKVDPDFFDVAGGKESRSNKELFAAQLAKFTQNADFKRMLLATKRAKLVQFIRGSPPLLDENLMIIRDKIIKERL